MATVADQLTEEQRRAISKAAARRPDPTSRQGPDTGLAELDAGIQAARRAAPGPVDEQAEVKEALKALVAAKAKAEKEPLEAAVLSVQKRAAPGDVPEAMSSLWWFASSDESDIAPWWSEQRDRDLRAFWMQQGNDILQGAVTSMVKKFRAMNWTLEGPQTTVEKMQAVLSEAEFGAGWGQFLGKTITDYLTCDKGCFWELIGEGDPAGPMEGLPVAVAHLDSGQCVLTGDPVYPVLYRNAKEKICPKKECGFKASGWQITQCPVHNVPLVPATHRLHATRVVHLVDMPSPNESMKNVGFCAVSRTIASSQVLLKLNQYKNERLADLPQAGLLLLNNLLPKQWDDVASGHERERRRLGQQIWSNVMVLMGLDPERPVTADFLNFSQLPEQFDEKTATELYINIVALSFGVDVREFWPMSAGPLGSAQETLVQHQKAKGKGIGDLISTLERAVNWYILPKRVEFYFDFADDEEDQARAILDETKTKTIVSMYLPDPVSGETVATRDEVRQMLADNVSYFVPEFLEVDITGEVQADDVDQGTSGDEGEPGGKKPEPQEKEPPKGQPPAMTEEQAEKLFGRTVKVDRKGLVTVPRKRKGNGRKQLPEPTPTGQPLPDWEGQVEITPEDVADALRDWDRKVEDKQARGLLLTERPESG